MADQPPPGSPPCLAKLDPAVNPAAQRYTAGLTAGPISIAPFDRLRSNRASSAGIQPLPLLIFNRHRWGSPFFVPHTPLPAPSIPQLIPQSIPQSNPPARRDPGERGADDQAASSSLPCLPASTFALLPSICFFFGLDRSVLIRLYLHTTSVDVPAVDWLWGAFAAARRAKVMKSRALIFESQQP